MISETVQELGLTRSSIFKQQALMQDDATT